MHTKHLHSWDLNYKQAIDLQNQLAARVRFIPLGNKPEIVAGLDCAISKDNQDIIAAVVVLKASSAQSCLWGPEGQSGFEIIESASSIQKISFPYIPGLLSFREAPACLAAVEKLRTEPDLFITDGQGIAHPRRLGLAAHLGLFFDRPTIGCAKSRLTGSFKEPPIKKASFSLLTDKGQTIGAVVRTRMNVKPVFISVGHKCTLEDAIDVTLACTTKYRLPEPTRLAHQLVSKLKLKS